jgi:hypothetical protein
MVMQCEFLITVRMNFHLQDLALNEREVNMKCSAVVWLKVGTSCRLLQTGIGTSGSINERYCKNRGVTRSFSIRTLPHLVTRDNLHASKC